VVLQEKMLWELEERYGRTWRTRSPARTTSRGNCGVCFPDNVTKTIVAADVRRLTLSVRGLVFRRSRSLLASAAARKLEFSETL
jgi:hypothetical protein